MLPLYPWKPQQQWYGLPELSTTAKPKKEAPSLKVELFAIILNLFHFFRKVLVFFNIWFSPYLVFSLGRALKETYSLLLLCCSSTESSNDFGFKSPAFHDLKMHFPGLWNLGETTTKARGDIISFKKTVALMTLVLILGISAAFVHWDSVSLYNGLCLKSHVLPFECWRSLISNAASKSCRPYRYQHYLGF